MICYSTVASALNSLAAVTCQDFITGFLGISLPDSKGALYAKWISIMYGLISFGLVSIISFYLKVLFGLLYLIF